MQGLVLIEEIRNYFNDNEYKKAMNAIDVYLNEKDLGVYDWILDTYIKCQIKLGLFNEAEKNLEIMIKLFPKFYSPLELATKYAECGKTDKLINCLLNNKFSSIDFFRLAKTCFYQNNHKEAEELFNVFLYRSDDEKSRETARQYLKKIAKYNSDKDVFVETSYAHFKSLGQSLTPGHVIYVDRLREKYEENVLNDDPLKLKRPYMIWKIVDETIYAFPVASVKKSGNDNYLLYHQNYSCCNFDRKLKDRLVCLEKKDVKSIIDKLNPRDYKIIIENMYYSTCFCKEPLKKEIKIFMETFARTIRAEQYDIMRLYDYNSQSAKFFFILDFDSKNEIYKVIEVNKLDRESFELKNSEILEMKKGTPILNVYNSTPKQQKDLFEQLSNVYNKNNYKVKTHHF